MMKQLVGLTASVVIFLVFFGRNAEATDSEIMSHCKGMFENNYTMLEHCIKGEEESKKNIEGKSTSPEIMSHCKGMFKDNYTMLEHCIKSEEEAKTRLGLS